MSGSVNQELMELENHDIDNTNTAEDIESINDDANAKDIKKNSKQALTELVSQIESLIAPLGFDVVSLEMTTAGGRVLRLYIDFLENQSLSDPSSFKRISLDDCVVVNHAVDQLLETTPLIDGAFNLEVSSPGVERPLRKTGDYIRFAGQKVRIHTFRPLTLEEAENATHWNKNKRQKNFIGTLLGLSENQLFVLMKTDGQSYRIPAELISKAHLEFVEPKSNHKIQ